MRGRSSARGHVAGAGAGAGGGEVRGNGDAIIVGGEELRDGGAVTGMRKTAHGEGGGGPRDERQSLFPGPDVGLAAWFLPDGPFGIAGDEDDPLELQEPRRIGHVLVAV